MEMTWHRVKIFRDDCSCKRRGCVVFLGGDFVHGSVVVGASEPTRYVAYAQFWPTASIGTPETFENKSQQTSMKSDVAGVDDNCDMIESRKRKRKRSHTWTSDSTTTFI